MTRPEDDEMGADDAPEDEDWDVEDANDEEELDEPVPVEDEEETTKLEDFEDRMEKWEHRPRSPKAMKQKGMVSAILGVAWIAFVIVWLFFFATGVSLFVLRHKDPQTPRPYKTTAFPLTPLIFCASCLFMLYNSISYALSQKPVAFKILASVVAAGLVIYLLFGSRKKEPPLAD